MFRLFPLFLLVAGLLPGAHAFVVKHAGYGVPTSRSLSMTATTPEEATASSTSATINYGGIPHVTVLVGNAKDALRYYTDILGMEEEPESSSSSSSMAVVRVGETLIHLLESPNPDPIAVDPSYDMSAPPPGYVAKGRPVHAGRDRHVAITLNNLSPLKESLESNNVPFTMSASGRQALFCRDDYGNGWEFGPHKTFGGNTRLFPQYLAPIDPPEGQPISWGGVPHVGVLVSDTPAAKRFYCDVLGMVDETDLRPKKLPFDGLFLRCGEQQVHIMELPNPDPNAVEKRPGHGIDRRTTYSVKSLEPVKVALQAEGVAFRAETLPTTGESVLYCYDPDANELMFVEDENIQVIQEDTGN